MFLDIVNDRFGGFEIAVAGIATALVLILVLVLFFVIRYKKNK